MLPTTMKQPPSEARFRVKVHGTIGGSIALFFSTIPLVLTTDDIIIEVASFRKLRLIRAGAVSILQLAAQITNKLKTIIGLKSKIRLFLHIQPSNFRMGKLLSLYVIHRRQNKIPNNDPTLPFNCNSLLNGGDRKGARVALNNSHNNTKNPQSRRKNLDNQNLNKEGRILCISYGTTRSSNSNRNS